MTNESLNDKLEDLHKQATTDRSHYYVGAVVKEAITEIKRLQEYEWMYKDFEGWTDEQLRDYEFSLYEDERDGEDTWFERNRVLNEMNARELKK